MNLTEDLHYTLKNDNTQKGGTKTDRQQTTDIMMTDDIIALRHHTVCTNNETEGCDSGIRSIL